MNWGLVARTDDGTRRDYAVFMQKRVSARALVVYQLHRRWALQQVARGAATRADVCDAHPHLMTAARFHGEVVSRSCPICGERRLVLLRYVYSDELGQYSGRLRTAGDVRQMARGYGHLRVFVVEVCRGCKWNLLLATYVVGDGVARRPPRRQPTIEDE